MQETSVSDPALFQYIGYAAATLTTASFLPQAIMTIRTRDTQSISLSMYLMFVTGIFLWLIYGLYLKDSAMIYANTVTAVLALVILAIKVKNLLEDTTCPDSKPYEKKP